ncbi:MAG: type II toxin-antitoxin system HicA family toxin [Mycobacterium sp.]
MIAEEQTRIILRELGRVGWTRKRSGKGSHSVWQCSTGRHQVTVPDGHRTIRPGVVRTIRDAIAGCDC